MSAAPEAVLRLVDVRKVFGEGASRVVALDGVSFEMGAGELVAVTGRSGSGKSTLLHVVAGLDPPTSGEVWVLGRERGRLDDDALTRMRRESVGMVHQFFHLLPTLSVRENVALPALLAGGREDEALARADALLEAVGLGARRQARPHTLSGGEMQRAAVARALVHEPAIVLADEPTGNLDSRSAGPVMEALDRLARERGVAVLMVTHSAEAAAFASRRLELSDGRVIGDTGAPA